MPESKEPSMKEREGITRGEYRSIKQLAETLNCSHVWINELIYQKRIYAVKFGNRWKIPPEEWDRILREGVPTKPRDDKQPPVNVIRVPEDIRKKMMTSRRKPQEDPPLSEPPPEPKKNPYWPLPFKL